MKVRYQIDITSTIKHPMLIADIQQDYIEVIAIDKVAGRYQNLYHLYNIYVDYDNPKEKVIYEDSYAQLNTKLTIELFSGLSNYRKTTDLLSKKKLEEILKEYNYYQSNNKISEDRIVHMTKYEILELNEN